MTLGPGFQEKGAPLSGSASSSGAYGPEVGNRGPRSQEGLGSQEGLRPRSARGLTRGLGFESYLALPPEPQEGAEVGMNDEGARGPSAREEVLLCLSPEATQVLPASARHPERGPDCHPHPGLPDVPSTSTPEGGVASLTRTGPRSDFLRESPHGAGVALKGGRPSLWRVKQFCFHVDGNANICTHTHNIHAHTTHSSHTQHTGTHHNIHMLHMQTHTHTQQISVHTRTHRTYT